MGGEWRQTRLGDIVEIFDGPHATPKKASAGPIFLGISNLSGGRIDLADAEHLSEEDFARWTRRVTPSPGDLVFSYETRLGEVALIPQGLRCCLGRRMGLLRARKGAVDPRFLLYAYLAPEFQETIRQRTIHGSTVDRIPLIEMQGFAITIPGVETQRAIAHILGTIDDKIELNRQTNETLEAMARTLFKSWFVDFDPVRAKAEGRQPSGMDVETAKLFPSEFVESELGEIPKGWRDVPFLDFAELLSGGTPKTSVPEYWNGDIKWASAKDVSQCGAFFLVDTERMISREGLQHSATKMIPAGSVVVVARGATCGRFTVLAETMAMNQTCYALRPRVPGARWYLRFLSEQMLVRLVAQAHGSVFDTITTATFERMKTLNPGPQALERFETTVTPIVERIRQHHYESRTLARLRDALLPRLLSGELSVGGAERVLEAQA